jgi:hypothetical protein
MIDSLKIGTSLQKHVYFADELAKGSLRPFDGVLGRDLLSQFDLEFNVPARAVRLYARSGPARLGEPPQWLPNGLSRENCFAVNVLQSPLRRRIGSMPDTTTMDEADRRDRRAFLAQWDRLLEQTELEVPVVANGHRINATFDSGRASTVVNWPAAGLLGFTRGSPQLRMETDPPDTTYFTPTLELRVAGRPLASERIDISELEFVDSPDAKKKPMMVVGWRQMHDRVVFLSHSTGMVCISDPI